ncbi:IS4 family transposase [Sporosarcina limicola]|uniref:Transposase IS4-like domain-containing protein n=1 Tax=Sporosarcina limicola TaxID=34101 RepID=A0A927MRF5_9BACL|nr:IS4 family transposase [Sporosarcina limicola]MBE1556119.1 hypothetical protein [Sporosarcina limicola]
MKQFSTISKLLSTLISPEELMELVEKHHYEDVARKFHVKDLLDFFVAAALEKWAGFRDGTEVMASIGLSPANYSTVSKKAADVPYEIFKDLFHLLIGKCNRAKRRTKVVKQALLLVDSTTITVGKNRLPWAPFHDERSGIKLHVAYTLETGMPLEIKETGGLSHDGPAGECLANKAFILVQDRAYGKHDRFDMFNKSNKQKQKQYFVIRLRDNVELHRPHSLNRMQQPDSNVVGDVTCQVGTKQSRTIDRYRVVTFCDHEGHDIRVVTNVMGVSAEEIAEMYKSRWAIESFFHWIKGYLNLPILFGNSKNAVFTQLFIALSVFVLLKWFFDQVKKTGRKSISFRSFTRSFLAQTLAVEWLSAVVDFLCRLREYSERGLPIFG